MPGNMKYKSLRMKDHPLANRDGVVQEHRIILYDKIGPGTHRCHWCKVKIKWAPGKGPRRGAIVTDHLDNNGKNNKPKNLVPSCNSCNMWRSKKIQPEESFITLPSGIRSRTEIRYCKVCVKMFHHPLWAIKKNPVWGQCCSRSCDNILRWTMRKQKISNKIGYPVPMRNRDLQIEHANEEEEETESKGRKIRR